MSFEVTGKLYKKFDTEAKSEKFQSRNIVLEIADGNYPQLINFQLVQERCTIVDAFNEGEDVKVHFDLRGREWNGKYLTNLNCWRIEKPTADTAKPVQQVAGTASATVGASTQNTAAKAPPTPLPTMADEPMKAAVDDDLPF